MSSGTRAAEVPAGSSEASEKPSGELAKDSTTVSEDSSKQDKNIDTIVAGNGKKEDAKPDIKPKLSETAAARVDEIMKKIAGQVEFYLGDFNLSGDKFFRDLVTKDEGWVPVDTIMKCNRVKKFTSNPVDVISSLKKFSTQFTVDETGKRIKRNEPFVMVTPEMIADRDDRTVHVKRFMKSANIDAIKEYFAKFGPVEGMTLNKFDEGDAKLRGKFKGSVYCIFVNKADAETFIAAPEDKTMFEGKEMRREWKKTHQEEREQRMLAKREEVEKSKIPGSVLHLSSQRQMNYLPLKEYMEKLSPVRFLDCQRGQREGRVRFQAGVAKEVLETILSHNNNKIIIDGTHYKGRVLEGKEEATYFATYWDTFLEARNNRILRDMRTDSKNQFKFNPPKPTNKAGAGATKKDDAKPGKTENESSVVDASKEENGSNGVVKSEITSTIPEKTVEEAGKKRDAEDGGDVEAKKFKSGDRPTEAVNVGT